jgi:hypothetical protein
LCSDPVYGTVELVSSCWLCVPKKPLGNTACASLLKIPIALNFGANADIGGDICHKSDVYATVMLL